MSANMPASRPPSGAPNGGSITDQQETTDVGPNGQYVRGVRVTFTTAKGQTGSVFVPMAQYNQANVVAMARAAANRLDEVHGSAI